MTADMSTSLKVVNKAALCCASTSRSAIRRRIGLIRTGRSLRTALDVAISVVPSIGNRCSLLALVTIGAGDDGWVDADTAEIASAFVTRWPGPLPEID